MLVMALLAVVELAILLYLGSGLVWLLFGSTIADYDGTDLRLTFPGHLIYRSRTISRADLGSVAVWRPWFLSGFLTRRAAIAGTAGPLVVTSWDGFDTPFGGDISRKTAAEVVTAVRSLGSDHNV